MPPTIVVRATYPGANPKTIAETVASPLEQAVNAIKPGAWEEAAEVEGLAFIENRVNSRVGRYPVVKGHVSPFEHKLQFLPIHPARVHKAVVEVHENFIAVAHGALHLVLDLRVLSATRLCRDDRTVRTSGGRVLCVTALGDSLRIARGRAYEAIDRIRYDGMQYRRDIAHRALKKSR